MREKHLSSNVKYIIDTWLKLTPRESNVLISRFSMGKTQDHLAKKYNVKIEKIEQIENNALNKIAHGLNVNSPDAFDMGPIP